jgi:multidrug efflux pump subunit AcrB
MHHNAHWMDRWRQRYERLLSTLLDRRGFVLIVSAVIVAAVLVSIVPRLGTELFPQSDSARFQGRLRAPTGTRIERTEELTLTALEAIKAELGATAVRISTAFIGVQPASYPINTIYLWTSGPHEAVLLVELSRDTALRGDALHERLRARLRTALPDVGVSFEAGDIVSQVMSVGAATPIEIAVQGASLQTNREHADKIRAELEALAYLRDVQFAQPLDYPTLDVTIDRQRAGQFGLTMSNVARSLLMATSSSRFVEPNYWRDPVSGNAFQIQVEIPQSRMASAEDVAALPLMRNGEPRPQVGDVASIHTGTVAGLIERYNGQRVVSLTANVFERPLGSAIGDIRAAIARAGDPPRGVTVALRGQIPALEQTESGLRTGLLLALAVIFLLLAGYFQSVRLALIVLSTAPAVLSGVALALIMTGTTLNVQSFMGAIMAIGIAVANAILLVTFAEERRRQGASAIDAARVGSADRLRAILMTAGAMMAGMLPMALGLGDGGAYAAPLGRAVIGGLAMATLATLLMVPALYTVLQARASTASPSLNPDDEESLRYEMP